MSKPILLPWKRISNVYVRPRLGQTTYAYTTEYGAGWVRLSQPSHAVDRFVGIACYPDGKWIILPAKADDMTLENPEDAKEIVDAALLQAGYILMEPDDKRLVLL